MKLELKLHFWEEKVSINLIVWFGRWIPVYGQSGWKNGYLGFSVEERLKRLVWKFIHSGEDAAFSGFEIFSWERAESRKS